MDDTNETSRMITYSMQKNTGLNLITQSYTPGETVFIQKEKENTGFNLEIETNDDTSNGNSLYKQQNNTGLSLGKSAKDDS